MRRAAVCLLVLTGCSSTFDLPLQLDGPTAISATSELEQVALSWSKVERADSYFVYSASSELLTIENWEELGDGAQAMTTDTTFVVDNLAGGSTYYFLVTGIVGSRETKATGRVDAVPISPGAAGPMPLDLPHITIASGIGGSSFGESVSVSGDANNDGIVDVAVGASTANNPVQSGRAFFFLGGSPLPTPTETGMTSGTTVGELMGRGVALVGDLSGDGFADALVGAPGAGVGSGRIDVHLGTASGIPSAAPAVPIAGASTARLGRGISAFTDVDGDTALDVLVGAPGFDGGQTNEGAVMIYFGGDAGTGIDTGRAPVTFESDMAGSGVGETVSAAGDVDQNGFQDFIAGAPTFDSGNLNEGAIFLYLMDAGITATATIFESNAQGANLGPLAGNLNFNGDQYADFAGGAPGFSDGAAGESEGRVFLFHGSTSPDVVDTVDGGGINVAYGSALAGGDINGDGYDDLVVGAPGLQTTAPRIDLLLGSASGLDTTPAWTTGGGQPAGSGFGAAIAVADLNDDAIPDIVVGAPSLSDTTVDEGGVLLFLGPPRRGPTATAGDRLLAEVGDAVQPINASVLDPAIGPVTCTWDWGDATAPAVITDCTDANINTAIHAYATAGEFTLTLEVSNGYGLYGKGNVIIAIRPIGEVNQVDQP